MITLDIETREIDRAALRVRGFRAQLQRPAGIMRTVAEGVEHQTRRRIEHEKTDPGGRAWRPWSAAYAKTRKSGVHSLLMDTWAMVRDGLDHRATGTTAMVFVRRAVAPYAGRHQAGDGVPRRAFLGLSVSNARDLESWLGPLLESVAAEALKGAPARV